MAVAVLPGLVSFSFGATSLVYQQGEPTPWESGRPAIVRGPLDERVFARWASSGMRPAGESSDAAFLRRVYLDTIGLLPTRAQAFRFLEDTAPDKRSVLIDDLLARPEFADRWALRWADVLRIKAEYPSNLWPNAAQAYHRWLRDAIAADMPLDVFASALLLASGSNFRVGQVNFYRAMPSRDPATISRMVALSLLGQRTETWPVSTREGFAGFFSQLGYKGSQEWKEEIVFWDDSRGRPETACTPSGEIVFLEASRDPRQALADWFKGAGALPFLRCQANRVWYWLLGRGLVHDPDDFRPDNPPSNPELLDFLTEELARHGCSLRALCRTILNSSSYQLACIPPDTEPHPPALFSVYVPRRLDAEILADVLDQVTGTHSHYQSSIPEPYTFVPPDMRAVQLPDGSISSAFLELFGRPPRDTGLASERNNQMSALQQLHLLNSSQMLGRIEQGPALKALLEEFKGRPRHYVEALYVAILARRPTRAEAELALQYARSPGRRPVEAARDLAWALLNTEEFLFNH